MNKKRSMFWGIAFVMFLVIPGLAYASYLEVGGTSNITTSVLKITGSSTSTCNLSAELLGVKCNLWRDDKWVNGATKEGSEISQISTSCASTNLPGSQHWELFGRHYAEDDGWYDAETSYASRYY